MSSARQPLALVTGASRGLGRSFAERCAERGYNLLLVALPGGDLFEVAGHLGRRHSVEVSALELNLTKTDACEKVVQRVKQLGDGLDLLINNAGIGSHAPFGEGPLSDLDAVISVNDVAVVGLTYGLLPLLRQRHSAFIINVASLGAFYPMPNMAVYAASKAFVLSFTLSLRAELEGTGICVCALCPNAIVNADEVAQRKYDRYGRLGHLAGLTPGQIASFALDRMAKNQAVVIPGWFNRLMHHVGERLPRPMVARILTKTLCSL